MVLTSSTLANAPQAGKAAEMPADTLRETLPTVFGLPFVDQLVREAVQNCWYAIPPERRQEDELRRQMHRSLERALAGFSEDLHMYNQDERPGNAKP